MKSLPRQVRLSATDLSNHLSCRHLTIANLAVAKGEKATPQWRSPDAWVLQQRGIEHEQAYLEHLRAGGLRVVDLQDLGGEAAVIAATLAAMTNGADVIAQGAIAAGPWFGRPDVLRRISG